MTQADDLVVEYDAPRSDDMEVARPSEVVTRVEPLDLSRFIGENLPATRFRLRIDSEACRAERPGALLDRPPAVADFFYARLKDEPQEVMVAAYLDSHHRLIGWQEVFRGTMDRIKVEPRQILQTALLVNARCYLLCHCLCGAQHNECYVQPTVMWSRRSGRLST
ncbi:MAG: hypothetical protein MPN21_20505, partial [Thermoanaerobaculia bacterium]|nr:hypothetical protein [Thermoanaerobaculia bacterium]